MGMRLRGSGRTVSLIIESLLILLSTIGAPESNTEPFGNQPRFISKFEMSPDGFSLDDVLSSQHYSYRYVVTAVGKNNNESDLSEIAILVQPDGKWQFYTP